MFQHPKAALLALLLVPGAALSQIDVGAQLGLSETAIRTALEAQGYSPTEFEFEADEIEVEATKDGQAYEIEISPETGEVLAVYLEKDEDDDD